MEHTNDHPNRAGHRNSRRTAVLVLAGAAVFGLLLAACAIVNAIVAAHSGHVDAVPNPGGGATFTVRLPLARAAASPKTVDAT